MFITLRAISNYRVCLLLVVIAISVFFGSIANAANTDDSGGNSGKYSPPNMQAPVLSPQPPGAGGSDENSDASAPDSSNSPETHETLPVQSKPKVFSRVPIRSRL